MNIFFFSIKVLHFQSKYVKVCVLINIQKRMMKNCLCKADNLLKIVPYCMYRTGEIVV